MNLYVLLKCDNSENAFVHIFLTSFNVFAPK